MRLDDKMHVSSLPPEAYPPLRPSLAGIMLTERANLVVIPVIHKGVTVRAEIFILCNPWSANREKPHGCLLCSGSLTRANAVLTCASPL